jgi:AsmA protein
MERMPQAGKRALVAVGGLAAALVLAALAAMLFVDVDSYKPRVEAAASGALGMDVTVEGGLGIAFLPGPRLKLGNVRIRNRGSEILFAEEADLAIRLLPLLRKELRYDGITLNRARVSIERGRDGRYNFQKPPGLAATFRALELPRLSFPELVVVYADRISGGGFEASGCKGELTDMRHPGGAPFLMRLSVSGHFACGEVRGPETAATGLELPIEAADGVFDFKPVTMRVFGGQGSGGLRMDRSAAVPALHLDYSLSKIRIEEVFGNLPPGKTIAGLMDFSTRLAMRGRTRAELRKSADGDMTLSGVNLTLDGVDLDRQYSRFEASQTFNLFDVAALLLAGPIGPVVTKGYEFSSLAQAPGGSTQIRTVVSKWKVEKGVAHARDVALTTRDNRIALQGGLDFVDDEFDEVFVALVDANGCAKLRQRVRGPFGKPVVEKPAVLASLTGPLRNLLDKARDLLPGTGDKCEVFYNGSVAQPKQPERIPE